MSDDELPPLDDFQADIKTISISHKPPISSSEDYTKENVRHLEDESKQKQEIKKIQKKVQKIAVQVQSNKKKPQYAGFKKGFFNSGPKEKQEPKITEVKVTKKSNPLQIKEVQQAMKMNDYLQSTKKQWMTNNFLTDVQKNQKIQKLFTKPEFIKAVSEFQTNPKEAMAKYGNNKELMEGFQQFCKLMGTQFQSLAKATKK